MSVDTSFYELCFLNAQKCMEVKMCLWSCDPRDIHRMEDAQDWRYPETKCLLELRAEESI